MCKPHKDNEFKGTYEAQTNQEKLSRDDYKDQLSYINSHESEKEPAGNPCPTCKVQIKYEEVFDAFYCPECKEWLNDKCSDEECFFCKNRPEKAI